MDTMEIRMNIRRLIREVLEDAKRQNFHLMGQFEDYIKNDIPNFFIHEGGIDEVLHFLAQEDGMNFRLQHLSPELPDFSQERKPTSDNEIERILQANQVPYSLAEVKHRLYQYFVRRLAYNTPKDRVFASPEEALDFVKTYEQQFFYEYLLPMARIHKTKAGTSS
jgi:hypothetical protein